MTKDEIIDWAKHHVDNLVDRQYEEDDGNLDEIFVYEIDGKLFAIYKCNGTISEKYGDNGYVRGEYELKEVEKRTQMVEEITYSEVRRTDETKNGIHK